MIRKDEGGNENPSADSGPGSSTTNGGAYSSGKEPEVSNKEPAGAVSDGDKLTQQANKEANEADSAHQSALGLLHIANAGPNPNKSSVFINGNSGRKRKNPTTFTGESGLGAAVNNGYDDYSGGGVYNGYNGPPPMRNPAAASSSHESPQLQQHVGTPGPHGNYPSAGFRGANPYFLEQQAQAFRPYPNNPGPWHYQGGDYPPSGMNYRDGHFPGPGQFPFSGYMSQNLQGYAPLYGGADPRRMDHPYQRPPPEFPPAGPTGSARLLPVEDLNENDVLCGRGGASNSHSGNVSYRKLVREYKHKYLQSRKAEKPSIAVEIVSIIRNKTPSGRFLERDKETGHFIEVGDTRAKEKVSQALREGAPQIRKQISKDKAKEKSDFVWDFDASIVQLKAFKAKHGHTEVTESLDKSLHKFCSTMQKARKKPESVDFVLTEKMIKTLDAAGMKWESEAEKKPQKDHISGHSTVRGDAPSKNSKGPHDATGVNSFAMISSADSRGTTKEGKEAGKETSTGDVKSGANVSAETSKEKSCSVSNASGANETKLKPGKELEKDGSESLPPKKKHRAIAHNDGTNNGTSNNSKSDARETKGSESTAASQNATDNCMKVVSL